MVSCSGAIEIVKWWLTLKELRHDAHIRPFLATSGHV